MDFTVIVAIFAAVAFMSAMVVFTAAVNRSQSGLGVLVLAMAIALAMFGVDTVIAWQVDPPQPTEVTQCHELKANR